MASGEGNTGKVFGLSVIATNKTFFQGRVRSVTLPAVNGSETFLPHHENMIISIQSGALRFETESGEKREAAVSNGFAEMINNRLHVFVLTAERPEDIDVRRAEEAKERALEELRQKQSIQEYQMSQMALARAMTRLRVTKEQEYHG